MMEQKNANEADAPLSSTDLACERTMLAHERTLMAWVRTAISMISFGFTIYKVFEEFSRQEGRHSGLFTPRLVGMTMIGFGLLALLLAQLQHQIALKKIRKIYPAMQKSISSIIGVLVLMFGLALFLGALFRQ
jgi:putative membrane protein